MHVVHAGAAQQVPVAGRLQAGVDPGVAARQALGRDPCVVQGLPDDFEQDALLRVEPERLERRDAEEARVEPGDVVQVAARAAEHVAAPPGGVVLDVEPVLGDRAEHVPALADDPPELTGSSRTG